MTNINKANPTGYILTLPLVPGTDDVSKQKNFSMNIISTILPTFTLTPVEIPWRGTTVWSEGGGMKYDDWNTDFLIDDQWESYFLIYNWLRNIANGMDKFGRNDFDYQINGNLTILDDYETPIVDFVFNKIWPTSLGNISLSYQDGEKVLSGSVTFKYDYFYKKQIKDK